MNCMGFNPNLPTILTLDPVTPLPLTLPCFRPIFELYFVYKNFHGYDVREDKKVTQYISHVLPEGQVKAATHTSELVGN